MTDHALAFGFSPGFLVAAGIALLITVLVIRVRRDRLTSKPATALGMAGFAMASVRVARPSIGRPVQEQLSRPGRTASAWWRTCNAM